MLPRIAILVAVFACFGCTGPGPGAPARSAADPAALEAAPVAALAAPDPLPEAAWSATATGSSFELMTEPGELPYLALAESGSTARLPLEHTHINAFLNGMVAEVEVRQTYKNPAPDAIEAVYTFPLPENSAVNSCKW